MVRLQITYRRQTFKIYAHIVSMFIQETIIFCKVQACTACTMAVHARIMPILHASTKAMVNAGAMAIIHACTMAIVHARIMAIVLHLPCS